MTRSAHESLVDCQAQETPFGLHAKRSEESLVGWMQILCYAQHDAVSGSVKLKEQPEAVALFSTSHQGACSWLLILVAASFRADCASCLPSSTASMALLTSVWMVASCEP